MPKAMAKKLRAIAAHYDACVFGIPGILGWGIPKHFRLVILSLTGNYNNGPPTREREKDFVDATLAISKESPSGRGDCLLEK
jgi:hypothetical protein